MNLEEFHKKLKRATNTDTINKKLKLFLKNYGINTYAMTCYYQNGRNQNSIVKYSHVSPNFQLWHDHYHAEQYDDIDSTSQQTLHGNLPVFWEIQQQISQARTQREKEMRLAALQFGADCGLTIPVNRAQGEQAILLVEQLQGQNCLNNWESIQFELLAAAHYYDHYLRQQMIKEHDTTADRCPLNSRQRQCLQLVAANHSITEIAQTLNIKPRTVNYHIQKINKKLGTKNKYLSVAKARQERLID